VLESQWKRGQGESTEMAKRCMGGPGSVKGCFRTWGHQRGVWMAQGQQGSVLRA